MVDFDNIIEEFEQLWQQPEPPNFADYVKRSGAISNPELALELAQVDMERRWRQRGQQMETTAESYWPLLARDLSAVRFIELVQWEYQIRHQFGDCPSRARILDQYGHIDHDRLTSAIEEISDVMEWPTICVSSAQHHFRLVLDRPTSGGRQKAHEQSAWTFSRNFTSTRIVLCESSDPSLSRNQFTLEFVASDTVRIGNTSHNRAFAVEGRTPLNPSDETEQRLPVRLLLGERRTLTIT